MSRLDLDSRLRVVEDRHFDEWGLDVREFPQFDFAMRDVRRAGDVIAGDLAWTDESQPEIRRAFQIANNWRDAHAYPMRSIRYHLFGLPAPRT